MARMTRTQITLEEDEYLFLKSQAAQRGASLSSVVRGLVRDRMSTEPHRPLHIWELADLVPACGCEMDFSGRDHDKVLADAIAAESGLDFDEMLADAIAAEFDRDEETPA
jgi:hypothetical protein